MMTIHYNADIRPLVGKKVGMLHWVMDPEVSGFIIGYDLSDNQVLICNFDVSSLEQVYKSRQANLRSLKNILWNLGMKSYVSKQSRQL
jgi:hypothetical protein